MYRRRKIFKAFLIATCICTLVLFYMSEKPKIKESKYWLFRSSITRKFNTPKENFKIMIDSIYSELFSDNIELFLIEPSVLKSIENKSAGDKAVHTLPVVTFGMIGSLNESWETFCKALRSKGFSANYSTDILGREVKPVKSVTTHIIIQHNQHPRPVVHIVVFYRKHQHYLWHGQLVLPERHLTFAQKPGIYESFSIEKHNLTGIRVLISTPVRLFLRGMDESEFIECNFSRAEKFYKKYPKDSNDKRGARIQTEGKRSLAITSKVFTKLGIPFTLSCGSLLGKNCRTINDSFELSFRTPGGVNFDIFMVYEEENTFWIGSVYPPNGKKFKHPFPKYKRCWTTLKDIHVRVPCNTEEYILVFNGKRWNIPMKSHYPQPNYKSNGYWSRDQWKEVMQNF